MEDIITGYLFYEIAAILVIAAAVGFLGLMARQPLIVSFIAVGILVGPSGFDIAVSEQHIDLLAELGIAVLLFLVGLKLDLKLVRDLGPVALTTGLGQVAFTSVVGFAIAVALGLDPLTAFYVAVALTFSSTIIIVKLLSDKKEIDALHGRIALGFLIVQDLVVVLAMIALSAAGVGAQDADTGWADIALVFVSGAGLLGFVALFILYVANPLVARLARAPELLVCFAIGWAALLAAVSHYLGFGKELGGLLAGVSLASTPFREAIAARLSSLRDFLLLFFFVSLGAGLDLGLLGDNLVPALVLAVFVLIGNPLIVLAIMGAMGYRKRTGFLAGLTVAQISEFSLIFVAVGVGLGQVAPEALGLTTLVGLITISLSTYMITYSHQLYAICEPVLGIFERKRPSRELAAEAGAAGQDAPEILIFGLGRFGGAIAHGLKGAGRRVLGVDFNPDAVAAWNGAGLAARYGDASDPEMVAHLPLAQAKWVVSAVPEHDTGLTHMDARLSLIHALREAGYRGKVAVTTHRGEDVERLRAAGADLVLMPFRDAADQAVDLLLGLQSVPDEKATLPDPTGQRAVAE